MSRVCPSDVAGEAHTSTQVPWHVEIFCPSQLLHTSCSVSSPDHLRSAHMFPISKCTGCHTDCGLRCAAMGLEEHDHASLRSILT
eukprot:3894407-Rhodomonas_salina.3